MTRFVHTFEYHRVLPDAFARKQIQKALSLKRFHLAIWFTCFFPSRFFFGWIENDWEFLFTFSSKLVRIHKSVIQAFIIQKTEV